MLLLLTVLSVTVLASAPVALASVKPADLSSLGVATEPVLPTTVIQDTATAPNFHDDVVAAAKPGTITYAIDVLPDALLREVPQYGVSYTILEVPSWAKSYIIYVVVYENSTTMSGAILFGEELPLRERITRLNKMLVEDVPTASLSVYGDYYKFAGTNNFYYDIGYPYGSVANSFTAEELWNDGSNTVDYWSAEAKTTTQPGWYQWPDSDVQTEQMRVKYIPSASRIVYGAYPNSTNADQTFNLSAGWPANVGWGWSYTIHDVDVENISILQVGSTYARFNHNYVASSSSGRSSFTSAPGFDIQQPQNYNFGVTFYGTWRVRHFWDGPVEFTLLAASINFNKPY